jgi:threonine/homoserine/homoserine lactone efflux protein
MTESTILLPLIAALALGTISPGPSFVMIARTSVANSRAHGIAAALGMGIGGVCFAAAALAGLQAIMLAVPAVHVALKALGGLYLCYLGAMIFLSARRPLILGPAARAQSGSLRKAFLLGLGTQISNPKAAVVYASVFAALLPHTFGMAFAILVLLAVFVVETGWYALVAYILSSEGPRNVYLGYKTAVDRTAGAVLVALGFKLVLSVYRE